MTGTITLRDILQFSLWQKLAGPAQSEPSTPAPHRRDPEVMRDLTKLPPGLLRDIVHDL